MSDGNVVPGSGASGERSGGGPALIWIQGIVVGALLTFETATVLVLCVLLAPAVIAAVAEARPMTGMTRAVALGCAAASFSPVWHLWLVGNRLEDALAVLSEPMPLLLSWGSGACAWALCEVLPVILRGVWEIREAARGRAIEAELRRLREEWVLDDALPAKK